MYQSGALHYSLCLDIAYLKKIMCLQVRVRVRDFGTPRRSSTSLLLVNVTRNLNAPQFNPTQYSATILETQTLGSSIRQVSSSDLDTTVSTCSSWEAIEFLRKQNKHLNIHWLAIKNSISLNFISVLAVIINFGVFILQAPNNVPTYTLSGNALALQYFQVNPSTGVVSLYKDLRDDTATSYTVSKLIKYNWNQIYDDN